jgi:hypothetical protein
MKYLRLFEDNADYQNYINGNNCVTPNICFVKEINSLVFLMKTSIYEWIDLGLPSGIKWSSTNVGATNPEDYGLYFAWGEIEGYTGVTDTKGFSWNDYTLCNSSNVITKYSYDVDNLTILEESDDAAYQTQNDCRMPTKEDFEELLNNTTSKWEALNGVNGIRLTSKANGNSIFIPAAGCCNYGSIINCGSGGYLWSNCLNQYYSGDSCILNFFTESLFMGYYNRCNGLSIRPVHP